jgi:hypothetical protein
MITAQDTFVTAMNLMDEESKTELVHRLSR